MRETRIYIIIILLSAAAWCSAENTNLQKLTGTPIGSPLSVDYNNSSQASTTVNTIADAFDGNLDTYFASWERSKTWAGLDLGTPHVITRVGWSPRNGSVGPKRVVLGLFEGSNDPDFLTAFPLFIISQEGTIGKMDYADINVSKGFRYVRYVGPNEARCNIAELEFYGYKSEGNDSQYYQLTNLPTVLITTKDNIDPYDKENEIESSFTIIYDNGKKVQEETGTSRLRGNASISFPKKPYRIKLDSKKHMFKDSDMKSPAKAKKWTLINNYGDKTLMRNLVSFEVARRMKMPYTPWSKPVDVIVNGEYKGCYQLTDQITIDKDRVNITEMGPEDIEGEALTGGYLLELDGYASKEVSWFQTRLGSPVTIKSPDDNSITTEQHQYIENFYNQMEARIMSKNFTDPELGYRSMLDEKSLQRYWLVEELTGNPDAFHSCYISKDRGAEKLRVETVWDFDLAFDNDSRFYPNRDYGDYLSLARGGAGNSRTLLKRIFTDKAFCDSLRTMWETARKEWDITEESLIAYIDSTAQELQESQRLNFIRWPILNSVQHLNPRVAGTYDGEVEYLREYIRERIPFLDQRTKTEEEEEEHYDIASAEDLKNFADMVNSGKTKISATLKDDIDFTAYENVMIGKETHYRGTFDGNYHSITVKMNTSENYTALFRYLDGTVQNLTVKGTIQTSAKFAAGISGATEGARIERCTSDVQIYSTVNGDGTHGGIVGVSYDNTYISECLIRGSMSGSSTDCCGGVSGWASGSTLIRNCLVNANITVSTNGSDILSRNAGNVTSINNFTYDTWGANNKNGNLTYLTQEQLENGEACYLMNEANKQYNWYQRIGVDDMPSLLYSRGKVYPFSRVHCDGSLYTPGLGYTNDQDFYQRDEHVIRDGICIVCGTCDNSTIPQDARGFFVLSSAQQLDWFAKYVANEDNTASAVLDADIDFSEYNTMIGLGTSYAGTFDGAGHSITINVQRNADYAGLFHNLSGTIQDLIVYGTVRTSAKFAGGIVSNLLGGMLLRCQCYVDIISTVNGDGTHGGLIGLNSESPTYAEVVDCLFDGSISGETTTCCGGVAGWASAPIMISNTLVKGEFNVSTEGSDVICRRNTLLFQENCYYYNNWNAEVPAGVKKTNPTDLADGTLCYQLNGSRKDNNMAWYQTLAEDPNPFPDSRHKPVYLWQDGSYHNDDEDGIGEVKNERVKNERVATAVYDLAGRKIFNLQPSTTEGSRAVSEKKVAMPNGLKKGIYIINGKKIAGY
ncbi:MAG: CotH kinase family protein [Bacteroidaceae bacterium]|nr:CotH kinase family protein [Bacteroidaceae bacterium]